jgi:hypothetical protein
LFHDTNLTDRINPCLTLPDKHFNLPQLRHYFLWFVSLDRHL